jgi:hypothetical protein
MMEDEIELTVEGRQTKQIEAAVYVRNFVYGR